MFFCTVTYTWFQLSFAAWNAGSILWNKLNTEPTGTALQRESHFCIPFLGIARPQSQFPQEYVRERFIYSQDRSTYFLQRNRQIDPGNIYISLTDAWMWKLGLWPRNSFSGNIRYGSLQCGVKKASSDFGDKVLQLFSLEVMLSP